MKDDEEVTLFDVQILIRLKEKSFIDEAINLYRQDFEGGFLSKLEKKLMGTTQEAFGPKFSFKFNEVKKGSLQVQAVISGAYRLVVDLPKLLQAIGTLMQLYQNALWKTLRSHEIDFGEAHTQCKIMFSDISYNAFFKRVKLKEHRSLVKEFVSQHDDLGAWDSWNAQKIVKQKRLITYLTFFLLAVFFALIFIKQT